MGWWPAPAAKIGEFDNFVDGICNGVFNDDSVSHIIEKLRKNAIKGKRRSTWDNPISNLIMYEFLDDIGKVEVYDLGRMLAIYPVEVDDCYQRVLPLAMVHFLMEFDNGKYPEFEE